MRFMRQFTSAVLTIAAFVVAAGAGIVVAQQGAPIDAAKPPQPAAQPISAAKADHGAPVAGKAGGNAAPQPLRLDGLELSARPAKAPFGGRDALQLIVTYKNVSDKKMELPFVEFMGTTLGTSGFSVEDTTSKTVLRSGNDPASPRIGRPARLLQKTLAPGEAFDAAMYMPGPNNCWWCGTEKVASPLPAGTYRLTIDFNTGTPGKGSYGPMEFEIAAIDANAEKAAQGKALEAAKAYALDRAVFYKKAHADEEFWKSFQPQDLIKDPPEAKTYDGFQYIFTFKAPAMPGQLISITVPADANGKVAYGGDQGNAGFQFLNADEKPSPSPAKLRRLGPPEMR